MAHIEPTEGQLQAAFVGSRRTGWPSDLAEALAHPIYGRLVRMNAQVIAQGRDPFVGQRTNHRPVVIAPEPPHAAEQPAPHIERPRQKAKPRRQPLLPSHAPALHDMKRAAAGDDD